MTSTDLARSLPHRWPLLLLDEVVTMEAGVGLVATRTVSASDPWCGAQGLPPYLVLESWLQACAVLLCAATAAEVLVVGVRGARVTRAIHPGETIEHRVEVVRSLDTSAIFTGSAIAGTETVLTVEQVTIATSQGVV
jgi:3-hydroxyacyl-[acyl-carrier-protein] dehydratase